jgi:signal transduction histidine kinase
VSILRDFGRDVPHVSAYASELNQVWTNLLENALDALDGKGEIVVRTRLEGRHVVVEIQDDGPGIPPELQPRIFNPFFTTKGAKGAGLGLDIARRIVVQRHGGELSVASQPGDTRFTVRLPIDS